MGGEVGRRWKGGTINRICCTNFQFKNEETKEEERKKRIISHSNIPYKTAFRFVGFFWSDDFYCVGNLHTKFLSINHFVAAQ